MGKQHIIELNGKRYDALTGLMAAEHSTKIADHHNLPKSSSIKSMDGVARRVPGSPKPSQPHQRPVQKSHTLMRKTVSRPVSHKLHAVATIVDQKPIHHASVTTQPSNIKQVDKSELIRKFSAATFGPVVQDMVQDNPKSPSIKASTLSGAALSAATVGVSPINQAIASATSHQQPKLKRPKLHSRIAGKFHISPKIVSVGATALAITLIVGFFGYQNAPNLKMRLASSRAGLQGTLPAYQPPGFSLNDISYKTGQINISFRSNSDARNFTVTQTASSWNSETLRDKLKTTAQAASPLEIPDKGKTLFIYQDSNAAWVDGGILYKIEGDSKLNSVQLLSLANSL